METVIEMLKELHPELNDDEFVDLIDDAILDSMDIVSLVSSIYNEFDVSVPAEKIIPENFNSAEAIFNMVTELLDD